MLTRPLRKPSSKPAARRGRAPNLQVQQPNQPHTIKLPDGRTLFVEIPGRWTSRDRDGSILFLPPAIRFLDRLRSLALKLDQPPTPGYITTLREALGMTQSQFGSQLGVDKVTVSRWERGELRPGDKSLAALEKLRANAASHGVVLPG